ncbi:hypothetical protein BGZ83_009154 [Gryganskiella cystojenkinii]|nr:hypothetical protein BGZ83_009154 [Gryganskiella cystojenkinii]
MARKTFLWTCLSILVLHIVASAPVDPSSSSLATLSKHLQPTPTASTPSLAKRDDDDNGDDDVKEGSSIFSRLLIDPDPTPTSVNLFPPIPRIPNILLPLVVRLPREEPERPVKIVPITTTSTPSRCAPLPANTQASTSSDSFSDHKQPKPTSSVSSYGRNGVHGCSYTEPSIPLGNTPEEVIASCKIDISPTLPTSFIPEIGIVRLFRKPSFKDQGTIVKGCGCIPLQTPLVIESFVGSRNHSFEFYSNEYCDGQPYFGRFKEHYDVEPSMLTASIRIVQGVLTPIPPRGELIESG